MAQSVRVRSLTGWEGVVTVDAGRALDGAAIREKVAALLLASSMGTQRFKLFSKVRLSRGQAV